jgi:hypothetical protein
MDVTRSKSVAQTVKELKAYRIWLHEIECFTLAKMAVLQMLRVWPDSC